MLKYSKSNGKPLKPKNSAPYAAWKAYQTEITKWLKDQEEKKKLIADMASGTARRRRRN